MDSRLSAAVLVSLLFALPAAAQNAPTPTQVELNRQAYAAMKNGQIDVAIELYEESLAIAPLNATFLNLGRAHQKSGDCDDAWSAYDQIAAAPAVDKPSPDKIAAAHMKFTGELVASCPTRIEVRCESDGAEVTIGSDRRACPAVFDLTPGSHVVRLTWSVVQLNRTVFVGPGRRVLVEFGTPETPPIVAKAAEPEPEPDASPASEEPPANSEREPEPPVAAAPVPALDVRPAPQPEQVPARRKIRGPDWGGLALIGTSLVIAGGSVAVDGVIPAWPNYAHDKQVTEADFIPVVGYTLAATVLILGIIDLADGPER